jgi:hypothetical protein
LQRSTPATVSPAIAGRRSLPLPGPAAVDAGEVNPHLARLQAYFPRSGERKPGAGVRDWRSRHRLFEPEPSREQAMSFRQLVACASLPCSSAVPPQAATMRIGINDDPDPLDPALSRSYSARLVLTDVLRQAVRHHARPAGRSRSRQRIRMVRRQACPHDQAAARPEVRRRRAAGRRGGEIQLRAESHPSRFATQDELIP